MEINRFRIRIRLPNDSNGSSPVNNTTDHWLFDVIIAHPNPQRKLITEGDCAPSDEVVGPPSNLKSQSTSEDDPREPENRKLGYHKTEDILCTLSENLGVT